MTELTALEQALPTFTGKETTAQRLDALEGAVHELLDTLRYTLQNLGAENFNGAALSRMLGPIYLRIRHAEGDLSSIALDAQSIESRVESAEGSLAALSQRVTEQGAAVSLVADANGVNAASIVAAINDAGSGVTLSADKIDLNGITTVADRLNIGGADDFGTYKSLVFHTNGARITAWYSESPSLLLSAARIQLSGDVLLGDVNLGDKLTELESRIAALEANG